MLKYRADIRTLVFIAIYFTLAIWPWISFPSTWYYTVLLVIANCTFSFFCAVIVHNTIHAPMFHSKFLNQVMQFVLSMCYGHPVSAYVPGHNLSHHKYTQTDKDSIRTTKARFKWNLLNQLFFFYIMAKDIVASEGRFVKKMKNERPDWYRQYMAENIFLWSIRIALILIDWKLFILFVLIPHQYAAWGIVGTNYWQHEGSDPNHPFNHSRTFKGGILNFFCFNNGFHGAHHDVPSLHWSLLPEYHFKNIEPNIHPNLSQPNLLTYLWRTTIWPGKRLDYLGNPVQLPPETKDEDWVADIPIGDNSSALGAIQ